MPAADLAEEEADARHIAELVAKAPPLSPEQVEKIRRLFWHGPPPPMDGAA